MKGFAKLLILGGLMAASAAPALADVNIVGFTGTVDTTNHIILLGTCTGPGLTGCTGSGGIVTSSTIPGVTTGPFTFVPGPFAYSPVSTVTFSPTLLAYNSPTSPGTNPPLPGTAAFYATSVNPATVSYPMGGGMAIALAGNGYFITSLGNTVYAVYNLTLTCNAAGTSCTSSFTAQLTPSATPEPSSLLLLGTGLLAAAAVVFRKRLLITGVSQL